jgi:tetratricopeptide (TPR) repeat protein/outer membrane protein assembly factor BamB
MGVTMASAGELEQGFFKKGIEYHNSGDFQRAIEMYKKAMDTHGLDKKTLVLLGNAYYMTREFEEAEKVYDKALSLDPNYPKAYFNLGIIYEATKKNPEAIKVYKRAIELDKNFGEAYANLGDAYKAIHDLDNAILNYQKALEIDSGLENAREGLEYIPDYLIERAAKRGLIIKSDELIRQGIALEKEGDIKGAAEKYGESLNLYPDSASGLLLLLLSKTPSKTATIPRNKLGFIKLKPSLICDNISPEVREFLGRKLGKIEFERKTMEHFFEEFKKKVTLQREGDIDLLKTSRSVLFEEPGKDLSEALALELKGDIEGAKKKYGEVLGNAPYLLHAYYLYGIFLELNALEEEALSIYRQASQYNFDYLDEEIGGEITGFFSRRPVYEYLKEMDVIPILKQFLESTLKDESVSLVRFIKYNLTLEAEAKIRYGFEKEESGESLEAISAYEDAINIDPSNPIGHYVLGLAYESRGLEKEAMEEYEKTRGADFSGMESSEDISGIIEEYLGKTTKGGHRVGTILSRYFEIIADDPEHMLELLGFIEDLKIESISKIIKSYLSTDMILGKEGKVVRDQTDFGGVGDKGGAGVGKVVRDQLDFGETLDKEEEKIEKSRAMSKISFELLWKYKTQRSIRSEASSSDGKMILAGSENGIVYLIDQKANSPWRLETGASLVDIDISPEGKYGVYCNSNYVIELLDCTKQGKSLWKKNMGKTGVNAVTISSNADVIVVSTNAFEIIFFDREGNQKKSYNMDQIVNTLDITDDGSKLLAASLENLYIIEDGADPQKLNAFTPNENIQSISISKKGDSISVGTREGGVYLLDSSGNVLWKNDILNPVYGVSVASNGEVVSGSMNGAIVLYSSSGELLWKYQTGENIWDVDISDDGGRIISGCGLVFGNIYLFVLE